MTTFEIAQEAFIAGAEFVSKPIDMDADYEARLNAEFRYWFDMRPEHTDD